MADNTLEAQNRGEEWALYLGGDGDAPAGAPFDREEQWYLYLGGDGDEPTGAPRNRLEGWYEYLKENATGGGTDTSDATIENGSQLYSGVTCYGPEGKVTGTMPLRTWRYTIPESGSSPYTVEEGNAWAKEHRSDTNLVAIVACEGNPGTPSEGNYVILSHGANFHLAEDNTNYGRVNYINSSGQFGASYVASDLTSTNQGFVRFSSAGDVLLPWSASSRKFAPGKTYTIIAVLV